jgi:acyl-coenzyme A thioesterase PaaI-like protein
MSDAAAPPPPFEREFVAALTTLFEETIAFNRTLGLRIGAITATHVAGHIEMHPDLVGHHLHQRLHGGVISATLDAMAGLAEVVRLGSRIASTQMRFMGANGTLLATGAATYVP